MKKIGQAVLDGIAFLLLVAIFLIVWIGKKIIEQEWIVELLAVAATILLFILAGIYYGVWLVIQVGKKCAAIFFRLAHSAP